MLHFESDFGLQTVPFGTPLPSLQPPPPPPPPLHSEIPTVSSHSCFRFFFFLRVSLGEAAAVYKLHYALCCIQFLTLMEFVRIVLHPAHHPPAVVGLSAAHTHRPHAKTRGFRSTWTERWARSWRESGSQGAREALATKRGLNPSFLHPVSSVLATYSLTHAPTTRFIVWNKEPRRPAYAVSNIALKSCCSETGLRRQ